MSPQNHISTDIDPMACLRKIRCHFSCCCLHSSITEKEKHLKLLHTRATSLSAVHFPLALAKLLAREQQASRALHVTSQRLHTLNSDIALRGRDLLQTAFTITTSHTISWHVTCGALLNFPDSYLLGSSRSYQTRPHGESNFRKFDAVMTITFVYTYQLLVGKSVECNGPCALGKTDGYCFGFDKWIPLIIINYGDKKVCVLVVNRRWASE